MTMKGIAGTAPQQYHNTGSGNWKHSKTSNDKHRPAELYKNQDHKKGHAIVV